VNKSPQPQGILEMSQENPIIFFDGVCHLCSGFVRFVLKRDKNKLFRFAPLQGATALKALPPEIVLDKLLESTVVVCGSLVLRKSEGVLWVFSRLGGLWSILSFVSRIIPRFMRDLAYDFVAKNRYRWFGKYEFCEIPAPQQRERFLD
jgi:predicted DCC family thiol-disulfide oxidoreductase YuxK